MFEKVIEKSKITVMFVLIAVIIGALTLATLPQREVPEFTFDIGNISTVYPGATPEEVEQQVTIPLEDAVEGIDGIDSKTSVSTSGFSNITINLIDGVNQTEVFSDIQQAINGALGDLPDEAQDPDFTQAQTIGALSSYHLLADNRDDLYEVRDIVHEWQRDIERMMDINRTDVKGFPDQQFRIDIDSEEMFERGLQFPDVIDGIESELNTSPLGIEERNGENVQLSLATLEELDEIAGIFIANDFEGEAVYLEDIAEVGMMHESPSDVITFEETPALSFTVFSENGVNIPRVHDQVDERMMELKEDLPEEVSLELFYTQKTIVDEIFGDLSLSFTLAVLSVILVTLLGLNVSSAVIVALAIPTSVLIGLIPLPFFQVDLNQISIIGIIIALGILVDDGIVVGDNIRNKYKQGMAPVEGALKGSKEVRTSIITSTLTVVFTFLPLVFIQGGNGDFIRALPTVLITTIIASTVVALTLVPIFLIWRQKKQYRAKKKRITQRDGLLGKQFDKLANWYSDTLLTRVVRHPWKVSIIGFVITTAFYGLIPFIPVEFFPSTDRDEVTLDIRMPAGTTIEETEATLDEIRERILEEDEHVYETAVYAGGGLPPLFGDGISNSGDETGNLLLRVNREEQSANETIDRWTPVLQDEFDFAEPELTTIEAGPPVGAPIAITLQGPDVNTLIEMSNELQERVGEIPESGTVRDDMGPLRPTVVYEPVRDELQENGIRMRDISEQISLRTDGLPLKTFRTAEESVRIQLLLDAVADGEGVDLSDIALPADAGAGENGGAPELISLDELLVESSSEEIPQIIRDDSTRTITVRVFPSSEDDNGLEEEIETITEELQADAGSDYTVSLGGETEARTDFIIELFTLFILVLFLIYIVMAIQFYSLTLPFLVMSTVHIAGAGAVIGLFLTQTGLGFMALMGIVSLAGIVVRNSIVLLEFIKQRRADGMGVNESVIEAGRVRLRPILLTAFTAIGALTPVALSGDVLFVPLAISIISGLLFSAIFTVIIVPAVYTAFATKFGK